MNEQRLIDANALRERLLVLRNMDSWYINGNRDVENAQCIKNIFDICLTEVSNAPTIDKGYDFGYADGHGEGYELGKNSRPQGKWRDGYGGEYLCTNCFAHSESLTPFCRHCGAKMKGGADK